MRNKVQTLTIHLIVIFIIVIKSLFVNFMNMQQQSGEEQP